MARLKDKYANDIIPALKEKFQYGNVMEVPQTCQNRDQYGEWAKQSPIPKQWMPLWAT